MKIFKYILILFVFVGFLTPIFHLSAEDQGKCVVTRIDTDGNAQEVGNHPAITYNACKTYEKVDEAFIEANGYMEVIKWTKNATQVPITPPAPTATPPQDLKYEFLAPLTPELKIFDPTEDNALSKYLNTMIIIFIGICAVLAVIMIVVGGMEYMTSELISSKEQGKTRITEALLGLVVALSAYALLNTINPALLNVELDLPEQNIVVEAEKQIKGRLGEGKCTPITNPSNPCSPENLAAAGFTGVRVNQASAICNGESGGGASVASGVDVCKDGNSFSFGLFQINIIAHADAIAGGVCSGIFEKVGSGTQGNCLKNERGICMQYDCRVKDLAKYQSCKNFITKPAENIKFALNLQTSRNWNQWGFNASCKF